MSQTAAPPTAAADARDLAEAAARRAGIRIRELHDLESMQQASQLLDAVWTDPTGAVMPMNLIRALASAGSYVAAAEMDGRMVGVVIGFLGMHDGEVVLHSHILGVLEATRGRSVGFALKHHQRAWCLARGITTMLWTFDPLVRRNAYFNLSKLGAIGARYEPNFYGEMTDGINAGDESDRMVVVWQLDAARAAAAAQGRLPNAADGARAGVLLDADGDGVPCTFAAEGDALRCRIPEDILALRTAQPGLARRWRHALRDTLGAAVSDGYTAVAMDRAGWYTLTRSSGG